MRLGRGRVPKDVRERVGVPEYKRADELCPGDWIEVAVDIPWDTTVPGSSQLQQRQVYYVENFGSRVEVRIRGIAPVTVEPDRLFLLVTP